MGRTLPSPALPGFPLVRGHGLDVKLIFFHASDMKLTAVSGNAPCNGLRIPAQAKGRLFTPSDSCKVQIYGGALALNSNYHLSFKRVHVSMSLVHFYNLPL